MSERKGSLPPSEADIPTSPASVGANLVLALAGTLFLFALLPLSRHLDSDRWNVREVDWVDLHQPPPKKTLVEQRIEERQRKAPSPPRLDQPPRRLNLDALETSLEVGPGDFQTAFTLTKFDLEPGEDGLNLVFQLQELDRIPNVLRRGRLHYPSHLKRRGVEGEVKLLVRMNEQGRLKVLKVISSTHPDFVANAVKCAEDSIYEAPLRNGKPVKTEFHQPIGFILSDK